MSFKDLVKEENKLKTNYKVMFIIIGVVLIVGAITLVCFGKTIISDSYKIQHIWCDYCGGFDIDPYDLHSKEEVKAYRIIGKDDDRQVCEECYFKAMIKNLDAALGEPKYIDERRNDE